MTTLPYATKPRIPRNAYLLYNDPYHLAKEGCDGRTDGRTDKNRQTIAVTLRRGLIREWPGDRDQLPPFGVVGMHVDMLTS